MDAAAEVVDEGGAFGLGQVPTTLVRRHGTLYVVRSAVRQGGPLGDGTPEPPFTVAAVRGI